MKINFLNKNISCDIQNQCYAALQNKNNKIGDIFKICNVYKGEIIDIDKKTATYVLRIDFKKERTLYFDMKREYLDFLNKNIDKIISKGRCKDIFCGNYYITLYYDYEKDLLKKELKKNGIL
jgi:hypothetical protein